MRILRFIWKAIGVGVAIEFFYDAVMFMGAWFSINDPPTVSHYWVALAFFGAAMLMAETVFPSLKDCTIANTLDKRASDGRL